MEGGPGDPTRVGGVATHHSCPCWRRAEARQPGSAPVLSLRPLAMDHRLQRHLGRGGCLLAGGQEGPGGPALPRERCSLPPQGVRSGTPGRDRWTRWDAWGWGPSRLRKALGSSPLRRDCEQGGGDGRETLAALGSLNLELPAPLAAHTTTPRAGHFASGLYSQADWQDCPRCRSSWEQEGQA